MSEGVELYSPILSDIELQKKKEDARERFKKLSKLNKKPIVYVTLTDGTVKNVDNLTVYEQEEQIIKCALDPIYFIETYLTVFDQTKGVNGMIVPFKLFDYQKDLILSYLNNDFNVANKYRQAGISTCTCAFLAWHISFNKNRSVAIIADKVTTAQDELMGDVVDFINGCPTWLVPKPNRKNTQKIKKYDNGSEVGAFAAKSGLRGYTPTLLFWDETAWTERGDRFWESASPTLQTGGGAIFVSCVVEGTYFYTSKGIRKISQYTSNIVEGANHIDDTYILGFDKTRKTNIFFNNGYVDTLKITTKYSELESSFNHKYWSCKNGVYGWNEASQLNVGDYISIQKNKNIWGDLKTTTPQVAYLLGEYTVKSTNLSAITKLLIEWGYDVDSNINNIVIPEKILSLNRYHMINFLHGLIVANGFNIIDNNIHISLKSKELLEQIRIILNNLGVLCEKDLNTLIIKGEYKVKFMHIFQLIFDYSTLNEDDDEYDILPFGGKIFDELHKYIYEFYELKFTPNKSFTVDYDRKTILKFIKANSDIIPKNVLNKYKHIIDENLIWVEIDNITQSKNHTYDFSMSNENEVEDDEFNMSIVYNQCLTHQTPNGYDPVFYKTFLLAVQKKNAFKAIELYWFNDPRYNKNIVWYKNKNKDNELTLDDNDFSIQKRISLYNDNWQPHNAWLESQYERANHDERKINQEVKGRFLGSGDNFIAGEYLGRIENEQIKPPISIEYIDSNMWIFEHPTVNDEYVMTIDVSSGHGEDYSTINILKIQSYIDNVIVVKNGEKTSQKVNKQKLIQVAEYYGKLSPQVLGEVAYMYGTRYNNAYTIIDITSGHGGQTITKMMEMGYVNIHYCEVAHKPSRDMLGGYLKRGFKVMNDGSEVPVDLIPGFFIGNNRPSVLIEFQRSIHMNDLIIHSSRTYEELKTFITVPGNRVADHGRSFHDDSIMGISIGVYTVNFDMKRFKVSNTANLLNLFLSKEQLMAKLSDKNERVMKSKNIQLRNKQINDNLDSLYGQNAWLFKR